MLSIAVTAAGVELALVALHIRPGTPRDGTRYVACTVWDQWTHHRPQPNCAVTLAARPEDGIGTVRVEYEAHGIRGPRLGQKRSTRILLLGDSMVQADELPLEQTMGKVMERLRPGSEVLQVGTSSWSPFTELAWLRAYGSDLRVDHLYLYVVDNDFLPATVYPQSDQAYRAWAHERRIAALLRTALRAVIGSQSRGEVLAAVPEALRGYVERDRLPGETIERLLLRLDPRQWDRGLAEAVHSAARSIIEAASFSEHLGIRFTVVFVPLGIDVDPLESTGGRSRFALRHGAVFPDDGLERWLLAHLSQHGIEMVSLTPHLRAARRPLGSKPDVLFFRLDGHLTAAGHRVAARVLHEHLLAAP